ncbi:MAG: polysaccharide biosynthesis tyrosine autokinase [Planctomycetota bacterium]
MKNHQDLNALANASEDSGAELVATLTRFLKLLRFRKKIVFAWLAGTMVLGAIYYGAAQRQYASTAKLLIVQQRKDQVETVGDHESSDNTMATQRLLVTSPKVVERAIKTIDPRYLIDIRDKPPHKWTREVSERLSASTTRNTNFVTVSYRSVHPEAAAAMVSAVTDSYLGFVQYTHKGTAAELVEELEAALEERNQELNAKHQELDAIRREMLHLNVDSTDGVVEPIIQRAIRANEVYTQAQERRQRLQATLTAVEQAIARGDDVHQYLAGVEEEVGKQLMLAAMGLSSQDSRTLAEQEEKLFSTRNEIRRLSQYLGPNHPKLRGLQTKASQLQTYIADYQKNAGQRFKSSLDKEGAVAVKELLARRLRQAVEAENQFAKNFQAARSEAATRSADIDRLQRIERELERLEARRDAIEERIANIDIRQEQAPLRVTVVQDPVPEREPISPKLQMVVLGSIFGGLMLGCGAVYVQDVLDDRFGSPEEMTAQLDVPILSVVRQLDPLSGSGLQTVYTNALPSSVESEAFRTLRTSLSLTAETSNRVLVTSSEPGDGKTTVTANTSVAFAKAGKRTIVLDCDLRKPGLTTLLELKGQPGVGDILAGDFPPSETAPGLIVRTEVEGLDIIPAGPRRADPAELLSGKQLTELLAWAEANYDQVIVDCPPVLAVSDAQIVGQLVDGAILVVRPEKNHRRMVIRAIDSLFGTGCQVLGVVANGVSQQSAGYGYGYGYGYGDGYGEPTETSTLPTASKPLSTEPGADPYFSETQQPRRAA